MLHLSAGVVRVKEKEKKKSSRLSSESDDRRLIVKLRNSGVGFLTQIAACLMAVLCSDLLKLLSVDKLASLPLFLLLFLLNIG